MSSDPGRSRFEARLLVCFGVALWLLAGVAAVWEVLALQPPDSPLHAGVLAGPIAQLVSHAFALGTGGVLIGLLWPTGARAGEGRWVAFLLVGGALIHVCAIGYAAQQGMLALQILDPRRDARVVLYLRGLGHALTLLGLSAAWLRLLRRF
jgi:hypothetical protein